MIDHPGPIIMNSSKRSALVIFATLLFWPLSAQTQSGATGEEAIPVRSALVVAKCGSCHQKDDQGHLTRISYQRRTPEGWEQVIKRMVRLNGVSLTADEARQIVKYLSKFHGLAPEESRQSFYEAERRSVDDTAPTDSIRLACVQCHSFGRIRSQRRTPDEWVLLKNLHIGLFPVVTSQGFYRFSLPPGLPVPSDVEQRHPVDSAIDYLSKTYPLITPEWRAWSANIRTAQLAGRWLLVGNRPGLGRVYGEVLIEPTQVEDEFTTRVKIKFLSNGSSWVREGRGIVYGGYSWRGRTNGGDHNGPDAAREAMLVSRDWRTMEGRWFWGAYDELAIDVQLRRAGREPMIAMLDPPALKAGSKSERVTIYGANLPTEVKAGEINFGSAVTINRVVAAQSDAVTVEVSVAENAPNRLQDVSLGSCVAGGALVVFDKVDYIKVLPQSGLARLGGIKYPKQFQQFEAVAYNRGADGLPATGDDLIVGPVNATWSVEEFPASYTDDDKDFVGAIDQQGLFTPSVEGPNPARKRSGNNFGEIWVEASYKPEPSRSDGPTLKARSYLVVTVPQYVRWETPEVSK